jgi:hypothetical protein
MTERGAATALAVAVELGLGPDYYKWASSLGDGGPFGDRMELPGREEATSTLERLGLKKAIAEEAVSTLPGPATTPGLWWLLERCRERLLGTIGVPEAERGDWPRLPESLGPAGRYFYVHLFLAVLPFTRDWHRERGVPEEISWASFNDLRRQVEMHQDVYGTVGIDHPHWLTLHLRGLIFEVGRLQYTWYRLHSAPEQRELWLGGRGVPSGVRSGDGVLGIHIPAGAPLTPEECTDSLVRAGEFFNKCFPDPTRRIAICSSWLLDEQLGEYLAPGSNILAFQRRFNLVPGWQDCDEDIVAFVFRRRNVALGTLRASTTLERAIIGHLSAGRHWHCRTGWLMIPVGTPPSGGSSVAPMARP